MQADLEKNINRKSQSEELVRALPRELSFEPFRWSHKVLDFRLSVSDTPLQELFRLNSFRLSEDDLMSKLLHCDGYQSKSNDILSALASEPEVLDLKINFYVAACDGGQLKPFPESVVEESYEGLQSLLLLNSQIPPLPLLRNDLLKNKKIDEHVIALLHWLITLPGPKYVQLPTQEIPNILEKVNDTYEVQPNYIFKAMVNKRSQTHLQWMATKEELMKENNVETTFAYYSGDIENMHSLTSLGMYAFQKKRGPKGYGVYLTDSLQSCLKNSPSKWVWGKSVFGVEIQTAVIVEFIKNHTDVEEYSETYEQAHHVNYFVADSQLIQLRFILLFARTPPKITYQKQISITGGPLITTNRALILASYIVASYFLLTSNKVNPRLKGLSSLLSSIKTIKFF